jgi:DNA-binding MarR family transcriptional regulator
MTRSQHAPPVLPCACASLRRAARAVTQLYDDAFRGSDLRATQFTLLQVLERKGESTQGELGDFLAIDSTTLTRTLGPLAKQGLLRARRGKDRRERYWSITPAGKRRMANLTPLWESAQARLRSQLGDTNWQGLLSDLAQVTGAASSALQ